MATTTQRERINAMLEECKTNIELRYEVAQALIDLELDFEINLDTPYDEELYSPFGGMKIFNACAICYMFDGFSLDDNSWESIVLAIGYYLGSSVHSMHNSTSNIEYFLRKFMDRNNQFIYCSVCPGRSFSVRNPWYDPNLREQRLERTRAYKRRMVEEATRNRVNINLFINELKERVHEETRTLLLTLMNNTKIDINLFYNIIYSKVPRSLCACDKCVKMLGEYADYWFQDELFSDSVMDTIEVEKLLHMNAGKIFYSDEDREELDHLMVRYRHSEQYAEHIVEDTLCKCGEEKYFGSSLCGIPEDERYEEERFCPRCQDDDSDTDSSSEGWESEYDPDDDPNRYIDTIPVDRFRDFPTTIEEWDQVIMNSRFPPIPPLPDDYRRGIYVSQQ